MQPAVASAPLRSAVLRNIAAIERTVPALTEAKHDIPEWFLEAERLSKDTQQADKQHKEHKQIASPSTAPCAEEVKGVRYKWHIGADLPLYSNKASETRLRNMADPNFRSSRIAQLADYVADFLWPGCQEAVDEEVRKQKELARTTPIFVEEEVYTPPEVPHVLPVTNWFRNSEAMRQSFVCDKDTRCKPRLSWYNPNDGMVPSNWLSEGLLADLAYYRPFTGVRTAAQAW